MKRELIEKHLPLTSGGTDVASFRHLPVLQLTALQIEFMKARGYTEEDFLDDREPSDEPDHHRLMALAYAILGSTLESVDLKMRRSPRGDWGDYGDEVAEALAERGYNVLSVEMSTVAMDIYNIGMEKHLGNVAEHQEVAEEVFEDGSGE